jgi:hypothetical protein
LTLCSCGKLAATHRRNHNGSRSHTAEGSFITDVT